jgi:hypothetical protein
MALRAASDGGLQHGEEEKCRAAASQPHPVFQSDGFRLSLNNTGELLIGVVDPDP